MCVYEWLCILLLCHSKKGTNFIYKNIFEFFFCIRFVHAYYRRRFENRNLEDVNSSLNDISTSHVHMNLLQINLNADSVSSLHFCPFFLSRAMETTNYSLIERRRNKSRNEFDNSSKRGNS